MKENKDQREIRRKNKLSMTEYRELVMLICVGIEGC